VKWNSPLTFAKQIFHSKAISLGEAKFHSKAISLGEAKFHSPKANFVEKEKTRLSVSFFFWVV